MKEDFRENTYLFLWEVSLLHAKLFQTCRDMNNSFKQDFLAPYKIYLSLISPTFFIFVINRIQKVSLMRTITVRFLCFFPFFEYGLLAVLLCWRFFFNSPFKVLVSSLLSISISNLLRVLSIPKIFLYSSNTIMHDRIIYDIRSSNTIM